MKYCPHCGADLLKENAAFCVECGQRLSDQKSGSATTHEAGKLKDGPEGSTKTAKKKAKKPRKKKVKKQKQIPEIVGTPADDGYDGYYNDVLPPDMDRVKEGLDKELIKKIVALCVAVIFIIGLCVVMMYVL